MTVLIAGLCFWTLNSKAQTNGSSTNGLTAHHPFDGAALLEKLKRDGKQFVAFTYRDFTFTNGEVVQIEPSAITVMQENGGARCLLKNLPENIQKRFEYSPSEAEEYESKIQKRRQLLVPGRGLNRARMNEHGHGVTLKFVKVDSEETSGNYGYGENAVDGKPDTFWHTQWKDKSPGLPHEIIIELLPPSTIKGFTYLPRQDASDHGTIRDYEFYVSDDGKDFGQPVKKGSFKLGKEKKTETFEPTKCRFIKLRAISEINGLPWTSAAEIGVIQSSEDASGKDGH